MVVVLLSSPTKYIGGKIIVFGGMEVVRARNSEYRSGKARLSLSEDAVRCDLELLHVDICVSVIVSSIGVGQRRHRRSSADRFIDTIPRSRCTVYLHIHRRRSRLVGATREQLVLD